VVPLESSAKHKARVAGRAAVLGRDALDLGSLTLTLWLEGSSAPLSRTSPAARRRGLGLAGRTARFLGKAVGGLPSAPPPELGGAPQLDTHVHVDVVQAKGLCPSDIPYPGAPSHTWSSDPFVVAQLLPLSEAGAGEAASGVRVASCDPVWEEELVLPRVPAASSVLLRVFDKNLTQGDKFLGCVTVPLPRRPPPSAAARGVGASERLDPQHFIVQGWYPLTAPPEKIKPLHFQLDKLGRLGGPGADAQPQLGSVYARVSWGAGRTAADLNLRPSLRPRIGRLRVRVHGAACLAQHGMHLGAREGGGPFVRASLEHQSGTTLACAASRSAPAWSAEEASFTFAVTEITSDLVMTLMERDELLGDSTVGELIVPLPQLLREASGREKLRALLGPPAARAGEEWQLGPPRWGDLAPPRRPGEPLLRLWQEAHPGSLGKLQYSCSLLLDDTIPFAYMAPDVLPPEAPPGVDASADFSFTAFYNSLGRVLDCLTFPAFAHLRTLLYLQTWQSPRLNWGLIALLALGTRPLCWFAFRCAAPLWLLLLPFFNGAVSRLIHDGDRVLLTLDEQAAVEKEAADAYARVCERWEAVKAATAAKMAAHERHDPSLTSHLLSQIPGSAVVGALGKLATSTLGFASDSASQLNVYKKVIAKLEKVHVTLLWAADIVERGIVLFTWRDETLTALLCALCVAIGLAASVALAIVAALLGWLGCGWNHVTFVVGVAMLHPRSAAVTRYILEWVDFIIEFTQVVGNAHLMLSGSGLAVTAPPAKPAVSGDVLRAEIEAESDAAVKKQLEKRELDIKHRSILRAATLTAADVSSGEWLGRLLARAPNELRVTHRAMAARANRAEPPGRETPQSASMLGGLIGRRSSSGGPAALKAAAAEKAA